jgi:hypothetical protein
VNVCRIAITCALGLVSGCYLAHEREGVTSSSCIAPSVPVSCTAFEPSGPAVRVSEEAIYTGAVQLQTALATPCGVLVSWLQLSGVPGPDTTRFHTRAIDWTGTPAADALVHASLTIHAAASGTLELVREAPTRVIAFVSATPGGSHLVAMGDDGIELGPPVALPDGYGHHAELAPGGLSYLTMGDHGGAPGRLVTVDTAGHMLASASLPIPATRSLWSRAQLHDGTFLAYSFSEDPMTAVYSGWIQHFDELGAPLAMEVPLGANGVPVQLAPTVHGAIAVWETAESGGLPIQARAIDANAVATSATRDLPASGALYGVAATSTPDGAVLVSWLENHFHDEPAWRMRAQVLEPDATPRGEPTFLVSPSDSNAAPRLVLDLAGERALAIYDDDGVWALPLACVR